jgi:hypothetical protein
VIAMPEPERTERRYRLCVFFVPGFFIPLSALPLEEQAALFREAAQEAEYFGRANDALGAHYRRMAEHLRALADDLELGGEGPREGALASLVAAPLSAGDASVLALV